MDAHHPVKTRRSPLRSLLLPAAAAALFATSQANAAVTFQDGDFNDPLNQWFTVNTLDTGTNSSFVGQIGTGGNPDSLLQGTMNLNPPHPTRLNASVFNPLFVFNPSTDGAITDFDFSMDATGLRGNFAFGIALRQNGNIFQRRLNNILQIDPFITQTQLDLTGADFVPIDNSSSLDFSSSGGAIDFGFFFDTSTAPAGNRSFAVSAQFDNFNVVINNAAPVPEPLSFALAAGGFALVGTLRRRSRRSTARLS